MIRFIQLDTIFGQFFCFFWIQLCLGRRIHVLKLVGSKGQTEALQQNRILLLGFDGLKIDQNGNVLFVMRLMLIDYQLNNKLDTTLKERIFGAV